MPIKIAIQNFSQLMENKYRQKPLALVKCSHGRAITQVRGRLTISPIMIKRSCYSYLQQCTKPIRTVRSKRSRYDKMLNVLNENIINRKEWQQLVVTNYILLTYNLDSYVRMYRTDSCTVEHQTKLHNLSYWHE